MPVALWNDLEAGSGVKEQLVYAMAKLAQGESWCLRAGAFASIKASEPDLFGQDQEVLYLGCSQDIKPELVGLRLADLQKLTGLVNPSRNELENALATCRLDASQPLPDDMALLHAILPGRCILTARVDSLLAILLTANASELIRTLYQGQIALLPNEKPDTSLAQTWIETASQSKPDLKAVLFGVYDLAVMGESPREAYQNLIGMESRAVEYLKEHRAWEVSADASSLSNRSHRSEIAALRKAVSEAAGCPLVLTLDNSPLSMSFTRREDLTTTLTMAVDSSGPLKPWLMVGRDFEGYLARYLLTKGQAAPRIILDSDLGIAITGRCASEAMASLELYQQAFTAILRAEMLQKTRLNSVAQILAAIFPERHFAHRYAKENQAQFAGEVALVTGGASGIGKACVESLLKRGAGVVTMDINPKVTNQYDREDYLGLVCDLTDEAAMLACYDSLVRHFGGLDMLVVNAGIFPAGIRIESLETSAWQKVMRINLDSNLVVMREAQPLLSQAPRYGRVLVNASKNVLAPGTGAAAYSASKAAVTQLSRVAALEWGKDHIRVNMIHPDAIFDTGIWTEEVLKARAAHYGMTVQQYKTRNVLGVELNSHYVGELVAEMLGPLFEKITGAQIPVDGGSDRVI